MKIPYKQISLGRRGSSDGPNKLSFMHQQKWIHTDLEISDDINFDDQGNLDGNYANVLSTISPQPPFPFRNMSYARKFAFHKYDCPEGPLFFISTSFGESRYAGFYVKVGDEHNQLVMRTNDEIREIIEKYRPDEGQDEFDYTEDPTYKQVSLFIDFLNNHLHDAKPESRLNYIEGCPSLISSSRKDTYHIPGVVVTWISFLFHNIGFGLSTDPESAPLIGKYSDKEGLDPLFFLNADMSREGGPSREKVLLDHYDFSKVVSFESPVLDQLWAVSIGDVEYANVQDDLRIVTNNWNPSTYARNDVAATVDRIRFNPGATSINVHDTDSGSSVIQCTVDEVHNPAITVHNPFHYGYDWTYEDPDSKLSEISKGFAGIIAQSQQSEEAYLVSVDARLASIVPFLKYESTDITYYYSRTIAHLLKFSISNVSPQSSKLHGRPLQFVAFDTPGMSLFPLTWSYEGDGITLIPTTNAPYQTYHGKICQLIRDTFDPETGETFLSAQAVGGGRTSEDFAFPGSVRFNGSMRMIYNAGVDVVPDDPEDGSHEDNGEVEVEEGVPEIDNGHESDGGSQSEDPNSDGSPECDICETLNRIVGSQKDLQESVRSLVEQYSSIDDMISDIKRADAELSANSQQYLQDILSILENADNSETALISSITNILQDVRMMQLDIIRSKSEEVTLGNDDWLKLSQDFVKRKLLTDDKGVRAPIAYDLIVDDIVHCSSKSSKLPIDIENVNDVLMVCTAEDTVVAKYPLTVGSTRIKIGSQKVSASPHFLNASALCMRPDSLGTNLLNGSLYNHHSDRTPVDRHLELAAWKEKALRVSLRLIIDEKLPLYKIGAIRVNDFGVFTFVLTDETSMEGDVPVLVQLNKEDFSLSLVVHAAYPDVWSQAVLSYMSSLDISCYIDRHSLNYVIPRINISQLASATKSDIYNRRRAVALCELSACFLIEIIKYGRTIVSGPTSSLNGTGDLAHLMQGQGGLGGEADSDDEDPPEADLGDLDA